MCAGRLVGDRECCCTDTNWHAITRKHTQTPSIMDLDADDAAVGLGGGKKSKGFSS